MRYRTQTVAYAYFVVALLLYGLQMVFGILSIAKYLGPDPIKAFLPVRCEQGDPHQPAHRVGADRVHGRHLLAGAGGIAERTPFAAPGLLAARPVDHGRGYRRGGLPVPVDRGEQAAGAADAGEARHRGRDADVPVQHRHDHLEGETVHHHAGSAARGTHADGHPVPSRALHLRQLHRQHLLPMVDGAPLGGGGMGDGAGRASWPTC